MVGGVRFTRLGGVIAATLVAAMSMARADQPSAHKYFKSVPTPTLETEHFVLPYAAPKFDFGTIDTSKFVKEAPALSFDTIDLGKSALRLNVADAATQPATGTPDFTNVIVPLAPGKKRSTRRYIGFTLTTATD